MSEATKTGAPRAGPTASFKFNHTMIRVKDWEKSVKFYTEVLGMELIDRHDASDFSLFFLGYDHSNGAQTAEEKKLYRSDREALLELTWNHGTESDASFKGYANGNEEPGRGFGHLAISVEDIDAACARFEEQGVTFKKKLTDGKMRHIAFILDPDNYWVEIIPQKRELGGKA